MKKTTRFRAENVPAFRQQSRMRRLFTLNQRLADKVDKREYLQVPVMTVFILMAIAYVAGALSNGSLWR
jgi:hypothetical protein